MSSNQVFSSTVMVPKPSGLQQLTVELMKNGINVSKTTKLIDDGKLDSVVTDIGMIDSMETDNDWQWGD